MNQNQSYGFRSRSSTYQSNRGSEITRRHQQGLVDRNRTWARSQGGYPLYPVR
jgi:hypothetical protein